MLDTISSGESHRVALGGGMSGAKVDRVTYGNGATLVVKSMPTVGQANAEQLAALVGRSIGAPVPRALRLDDREVALDLVGGQSARRELRRDSNSAATVRRLADSDKGRLLGLLDELVGNNDRHLGNWHVEGNEIVGGLDHGGAWKHEPSRTSGGQFKPRGVPLELSAHFERLEGSQWVWADNDFTAADMAEVHRRLIGIEDDFVHVNLGDWWDEMMGRFDAIRAHARGSRNRVAP
jgi:hypothetical protein